MEPGYYWARMKRGKNQWQVVYVTRLAEVTLLGYAGNCGLDAVSEWGERIVRGGNVVMNQHGDNCTQITNVGTLTIK